MTDEQTDEIMIGLLMSPVERVRWDDGAKTRGYDARMQRLYTLALDQENDLRDARELLSRIERMVSKRRPR
jgi:hypothetical protein